MKHRRKLDGIDLKVNTYVDHYTERVHPRGVEANIAAKEIGPGWSAKSDAYTGHPKPCCLCKDGKIVERFSDWEKLIAACGGA